METPVREVYALLGGDNGLEGRATSCARGSAMLEHQKAPHRVLAPLKRVGPRGSGQWQTITLEQLVREVCAGGDLLGEGHVDGLAAIRDVETPIDPDNPEYGPRANQLLVTDSANEGRTPLINRFAKQAFGTVNVSNHGSYCGQSYRVGTGAALGDLTGMPHGKPDWPNSRSRPDHAYRYVVVSPMLPTSSNHASGDNSRWLPIRPATDLALAMAMIRWIIDNARYDARFLAQPGPAAMEAAGEAAWSNATHLLVDDPAHPRHGQFLRAADVGLAASAMEEEPVFVVQRADGSLAPHTVAGEFTSHCKQAVANSHGGTMNGSGFYTAYAIAMLNNLVGNLNVKGGWVLDAGPFGPFGPGPRYNFARFEGAVTPTGVPLSRNRFAYERSSEFRREQEAGQVDVRVREHARRIAQGPAEAAAVHLGRSLHQRNLGPGRLHRARLGDLRKLGHRRAVGGRRRPQQHRALAGGGPRHGPHRRRPAGGLRDLRLRPRPRAAPAGLRQGRHERPRRRAAGPGVRRGLLPARGLHHRLPGRRPGGRGQRRRHRHHRAGPLDAGGGGAGEARHQDLERGGDNLNVDLKRFWLNVDHRFDENWSVHLTTDVQWQRHKDPTDVLVRHLYVQRRLGDRHLLRLGNAPDTWILPMAQLNGYRYLDPGLVRMSGHGDPADWGVHLLGEAGPVTWTVAAVTGAGFQKPRTGDSPDYQARVSWEVAKGLQLHLGGYRGTRAQDNGGRPHIHTAERWNGAVTWVSGPWRLGAEYFQADNWNRVDRPGADAAKGASVWGSYRINEHYAVFARHDTLENSRRLAPRNQRDYYNVALEWRHSNKLRVSAAYKHIDNRTAAARQINREFGLWTHLAF